MDFFNSHPQGTYSQSEVIAWGNDYYGGYGGYGGEDWWQGVGNPSNPIALNEVVIYGGYEGFGEYTYGVYFLDQAVVYGARPDYTYFGDGSKGYSYVNQDNIIVSVYFDPQGNRIELPGVSLSNSYVTNDAAYQLNSVIHLAFGADIALVQHEYGHYLQQQAISGLLYGMTVIPESLLSAMINSPEAHDAFWTETWANRLATEFFGPGSAIANDDINYPKYTPW